MFSRLVYIYSQWVIYNMTDWDSRTMLWFIRHRALYSTHFEGSVVKCFWQIVINLFSPWKYKKANHWSAKKHNALCNMTNFYSDLNVFPLGLVVEHMGDVFGEDLLTSSTSVDTHHGHTDGPRSVSYSHLQISIVCLHEHSVLVGFPHIYTNCKLSKYCNN